MTGELRGKVQTVLGTIAPEALGPTLMHEHLLWDIRTPEMAAADLGPEIALCNCWAINHGQLKAPRNYVFHDRAVATAEVAAMCEAGGGGGGGVGAGGGAGPRPRAAAG